MPDGCLGHAAGAIYANDTSNITILDSKFYANGGGQGGAISLWNSSLLVNGTTFYRNQGNGAGVASRIALTSFAGCESTAEDVRQADGTLDEMLLHDTILQQPSVTAGHAVNTDQECISLMLLLKNSLREAMCMMQECSCRRWRDCCEECINDPDHHQRVH